MLKNIKTLTGYFFIALSTTNLKKVYFFISLFYKVFFKNQYLYNI